MSDYLWRKCKGKYRVLSELDPCTNDVPRNRSGAVDEDYDDYYIPSRKPLLVRHGYRNELSCLVDGARTGRNILAAIYEQETGKRVTNQSAETIGEYLCDKGILRSVDVLDSEVYFTFVANKLDEFAEILALKTRGSKTHPLSKRNLSTRSYTIPPSDLDEYKKLIPDYEEGDLSQKLQVGRTMQTLTKQFLDAHGDKSEQRKERLTDKEYIHFSGRWRKYLDYLEKRLRAKNQ